MTVHDETVRAINRVMSVCFLPCVFETVRFPSWDKSFTLSSNMYVARGQHRKYRDFSPYCAGYCDKFHAIGIGAACFVSPDAYIKCKILPKVNFRERFL